MVETLSDKVYLCFVKENFKCELKIRELGKIISRKSTLAVERMKINKSLVPLRWVNALNAQSKPVFKNESFFIEKNIFQAQTTQLSRPTENVTWCVGGKSVVVNDLCKKMLEAKKSKKFANIYCPSSK